MRDRRMTGTNTRQTRGSSSVANIGGGGKIYVGLRSMKQHKFYRTLIITLSRQTVAIHHICYFRFIKINTFIFRAFLIVA